jgi:hypothetical protein
MNEIDLLQITDEELQRADPELITKVEAARFDELRRCADDFQYFARRWIKITHPKRGLVPFVMYPYQERMVRDYELHRFNIISKFRQGGATTTTVLWCMWRCLFKLDQKILVVSIGDREAIGAGKMVKNALENLPDWLKPQMGKNNDHEKEFTDTNSVIFFFSPKAARSMSLTYLIIDEAAFIQKMDELWAAMMPTLATGGSCVVISTVNGIGNWYEEMYHKSLDGKAPFHVIDIDYTEHPDYCQPDFAPKMRASLGEKRWLQEFERSFLGTGETYIEAAKLAELDKQTRYDEPIRILFPEWDSTKDDEKDELMMGKEYVGGALWIWKEPEAGRDYILSADVSEGVGDDGDFSAFTILDVRACEQVAEFYSNQVPPHIFSQIISQMGLYYNTAHVIVENMGAGISVLSRLQHNLFYENLHYDEHDKPGIRMGPQNRPVILEALQYAVNANILKVHSRRLVRELKTFIYNRSKKRAEAQKGKHDDAVVAMALGLFIRDEQVRRVPVMSETIADNLTEQFDTDLYERIKKAILENAPRDYLAIDDDFTKFKDEKEVLPGVIFGVKRPYDKLLKEFGW